MSSDALTLNAPKKLYIKTHGCQMNEYDSGKMADVLGASHGMVLTENELEADVISINTCSIREKAQEKVFSQLGRWRKIKAANPDVVIDVGGCVASLKIKHPMLALYSGEPDWLVCSLSQFY